MSRPATTPMRLRHTGDGVTIAIEDHSREPARMRDLARGVLPEWLSSVERDDAIIVVSELVTNALVHGRPPRFLHLVLQSEGLLIDVADGSPAAASAVDPNGRVGGRGLRIIDALSAAWGSEANSTGASGKRVWCMLRPSDRG